MSATSAPFGFRPAYHPSGLDRPTRYQVTAAYGTAMYKGQPCTLNTNGTVVVGAAAADLLGIIAGFEYIDANGKPTESTTWPAAQAVLSGSTPFVYVYDDPAIVYEVQSDGSIPLTAIGDQTDVSNVGNATSIPGGNPVSQCTVSASLAGAAAQGQFRIRGFSLAPDNAAGDAFTVVQVQLARSQFIANKVAI